MRTKKITKVPIKINKRLVDEIKPPANVLISWGGGKDSSTALLIAAFYANHNIFNKLFIITFDNYLATETVWKNREAIINFIKRLGIDFEWIIDDFGGEKIVKNLYKQALLKAGHPRAICVICNMMSEVLENEILNEKKNIKYIITGNTIDEFRLFKKWEKILGFKRKSDNLKYNSILGWSKMFNEWLDYLSTGGAFRKYDIDRFRLPKPKLDSSAVKAERLALFKYHKQFINADNRINFIKKFGWKLPTVKEGVIGTETDCMFPSIIYGLNLLSGEDYLKKLRRLEDKNSFPRKLLYRGVGKTGIVLKITHKFLDDLEINLDGWKDVSNMPISLKKYLYTCLLPVR